MDLSDIIKYFIMILAPIFAIVFKNYYDERSFNRIDKNRKKTINGNWKGEFFQDNINESEVSIGSISGTLKINRKIVKGNMRLDNRIHNTTPRFKLKGGFKNDRFLLLDYENEQNEIIQFGKLILELSSKADKLSGMFVSYGAESEKILKGFVELEKE